MGTLNLQGTKTAAKLENKTSSNTIKFIIILIFANT